MDLASDDMYGLSFFFVILAWKIYLDSADPNALALRDLKGK